MLKQHAVTLRRAHASDGEFAYRVLEETMRVYAVETWGAWQENSARIAMSERTASGASQIIEVKGVPAGVLLVERHTTHMQLEQLFLLHQYQSQGIGALVVKELLAEAAGHKLPVRLRVLRVNPAKRFYERLGFVVVQSTPERFFMERAP